MEHHGPNVQTRSARALAEANGSVGPASLPEVNVIDIRAQSEVHGEMFNVGRDNVNIDPEWLANINIEVEPSLPHSAAHSASRRGTEAVHQRTSSHGTGTNGSLTSTVRIKLRELELQFQLEEKKLNLASQEKQLA